MFVDLFAGGFNVGINIDSKSVIYNEIIPQLTKLMHHFVLIDEEVFLKSIENRISEFNLTKTNSQGYNKLREVYNDNPTPLDLYVLLCFSFNHLIRFNKLMEFNVPFGKNRSSFSKSMKERLVLFMKRLKMKTVEIYNLNMPDTMRLWGAIGTKYIPSCAYRIKQIIFDSDTIIEDIPPILGK